ncbi:MAG: hypothetical protein ACR2LE_03255 [Nocardioidaceae bacterium]
MTAGTSMAAVVAHVGAFQRRIVRDALAEASASYWLRRAEAFEHAQPRHGDYHGRATRADLQSRYDRLTELAAACRAAAEVALLQDDDQQSNAIAADIEAVLKETRGAA